MADQSRHKSMDRLRGYVRDAEIFKDHAGVCFDINPDTKYDAAGCTNFAGSELAMTAQKFAALKALVALTLLMSQPATAQNSSPETPKPLIRTLSELGKTLWACIRPPAAPYPGMRLTVRMTFNGLGEFIGQPKITFMTPDAPGEVQTAYKIAVLNSLKDCTPLHFSAGLGAAVAGRPYYIHFAEQRIDETPRSPVRATVKGEQTSTGATAE